MRGTRWEPFWSQLNQFQSDINHLFNRFGDGVNFAMPTTFPLMKLIQYEDCSDEVLSYLNQEENFFVLNCLSNYTNTLFKPKSIYMD